MGISPYEYEKLIARMGDKSTHSLSAGEPIAAGQEIKLHNDIKEYCQTQWPPWVFIYNDPTKRTHASEGAPDFVIYSAWGVLSIECKTKEGKLSDSQVVFHHLAGNCGHKIPIVRSMDDFRAIVAREKEKMKGIK